MVQSRGALLIAPSTSSAGMRTRVPSTLAPALAKTSAAGAYRTSMPVSARISRVAS